MGLYQARIPSYLDVPHVSNSAGLDIPDPQSPMGSRGVGEPDQGCSAASLASAITDALGGQHLFNRAPITPDMIVNHVAQLDQYNTGELKTNTF